MAHVLVTGAAGFIGSKIVERLNLENHRITAVDCLIEGNYPRLAKVNRWKYLQNLYPKVEFIEDDMRSIGFLNDFEYCDVVINLAAVPGLLLSWQDFQLYQDCNTLSVYNLLNFMEQKGIPRLVHASTSSVYGATAIGDEFQPVKPVSPYGITKLAAELLIQAKAVHSNFEYIILRYFSVYGPNQREDMAFSKFIKAIHQGTPITVTGDILASRSNTYVDDVAIATVKVAVDLPEVRNDLFNLCGTQSISLDYAIRKISELLGKDLVIEKKSPRPGDQTITKGDSTRLRQLGVLSEETRFDLGIERQVRSYLDSFESGIK